MDQIEAPMKIIHTSFIGNEKEKHADQEMVTKIAGKIRAIRLMKHLTIKQLAEKANVTKGLLSKIENSRTIPSLPVFIQILRSLDIAFSDFFADMEELPQRDHYTVIRKERPATMSTDSYGIGDEDTIRQASASPKVEMTLLNVEKDLKKKFQVTAGYRFIHVISGSCEYHHRGKIISLVNGDSIYFDGSIPHLFVNTRDQEAFVLIIDFGAEMALL